MGISATEFITTSRSRNWVSWQLKALKFAVSGGHVVIKNAAPGRRQSGLPRAEPADPQFFNPSFFAKQKHKRRVPLAFCPPQQVYRAVMHTHVVPQVAGHVLVQATAHKTLNSDVQSSLKPAQEKPFHQVLNSAVIRVLSWDKMWQECSVFPPCSGVWWSWWQFSPSLLIFP